MNLTGVQLSLGTVAALLMLIGYSVDTDILLSMRVLKRKGDVDEKIRGAMGTGLTMTGTTIAAVIALIIVSNFLYLIVPSFTRMDVIADMTTVLIFGLAADVRAFCQGGSLLKIGGSLLFLFLPMIPDFALVRARRADSYPHRRTQPVRINGFACRICGGRRIRLR